MMGDISIRSMSQEDAQEMCSWEYSGQYRVYNNSWEKMAEQMCIRDRDGMVVGTPVVEGAKVAGKVLKNGKGKKITVFTYRSKKDSKRKMGHRQPYTKVEITAINA